MLLLVVPVAKKAGALIGFSIDEFQNFVSQSKEIKIFKFSKYCFFTNDSHTKRMFPKTYV